MRGLTVVGYVAIELGMGMPDRSILLVDGDRVNSRAVAKNLIRAGLSVVTSHEAAHAISVLESKRFALMLVDAGTTRAGEADLISWARDCGCVDDIVAMTDPGTGSEKIGLLARGASLVMERPIDVSTLLERLSPKKEDDSFSGSIQGIDILEYLQLVILGGQNTIVEVYSSGARGKIYVKNGVVCHAAIGELQGEEALYRCLSFRGGSFANRPWQEPKVVTINKPGDFLLMEAVRKRDEGSGLPDD